MKQFYCLLLLLAHQTVWAQLPSIESHTSEMKAEKGFFNYYWNEADGKIWLEINQFNQEFLYVPSLAAGVGSNDIGLDRGQLGTEKVVRFERIGNKVLLVQPNYAYRAISENPDEQESVDQAFAQSVLAGFKIEATTGNSVLVEFTPFLMRDAHGVADRLKSANQGSYTLDAMRSALYLPRCKNFPQNTEWEATLTFGGEAKGSYIRSVTPDASSVTVRQHHSFVELPDSQYKPRDFDVRAGYFYQSYMDFAQPIEQEIRRRFIVRHRLEKKDPQATASEAVEPIVYYLDRGTPEPIRSALMEGASWWNQAFEAIGYIDAFQVKLLPVEADPMDVRYNMIQWVHRSTRGWSYGGSVVDPRTGEIIKGHVSLGSLRVRQDFLLATGILGAYAEGLPLSEQATQMALARLRQLAAHEVGHTLGMAHNFAASTNNDASVMDYPHPYLQLKGEALDLSAAYDTNIGEWDKVAVAYGYSDFASEIEEKAALPKIIEEAVAQGYRYITDADARDAGGAHPYAHLWDSGADPTAELDRLLALRKYVLQHFSANQIPLGAPMATLEESLVPVYLMHRYQLEGVSKIVGGMDYAYAVRGDAQMPVKPLDVAMQQKALEALIRCLSPAELAMPVHILALIPPRPTGYSRSRETFGSKAGPAFDRLYAAETLTELTLSFLMHPARATRLYEQKALDAKQLGLKDMLMQLLDATWKQTAQRTGEEKALEAVVQAQVLQQCIQLAYSKEVPAGVNALVLQELQLLHAWLEIKKTQMPMAQWGLQILEDAKMHEALRQPAPPAKIPDGSPIGCGLY